MTGVQTCALPISNKRVLKSNEIFTGYKAELFAKELRRNARLERMTAIVIGSLMYAEKAFALAAPATGKIDKLGFTLLGFCRTIGYWACIIMCSIEIIKALMQGDTKGISSIISKYILGFAALYFLPWIFDIIKTAFM